MPSRFPTCWNHSYRTWAASTPAAPIWFCEGASPSSTAVKEAKTSPSRRSTPTYPPRIVAGVQSVCAPPPTAVLFLSPRSSAFAPSRGLSRVVRAVSLVKLVAA